MYLRLQRGLLLLLNPEALMDDSVREAARERVAFVFGRPSHAVHLNDRFDVELKARPASEFKHNEFDLLSDDVQQMLKGGKVDWAKDIETVEEFCNLAEGYSRERPDEWQKMRAGWNKERLLARAPKWRRAIWRLIGV